MPWEWFPTLNMLIVLISANLNGTDMITFGVVNDQSHHQDSTYLIKTRKRQNEYFIVKIISTLNDHFKPHHDLPMSTYNDEAPNKPVG